MLVMVPSDRLVLTQIQFRLLDGCDNTFIFFLANLLFKTKKEWKVGGKFGNSGYLTLNNYKNKKKKIRNNLTEIFSK